jgi:crotonobetainyl-CoA:carnitine CoA-transferase CaiB-like acyl-CoA transferase
MSAPVDPSAASLPARRPLDGIRVLEMGQLMAGPFAGTLLAYFGAEVIKLEPPGAGDPVRGWRTLDQGTSLWWRSLGRNKRCVTLDLRQEAGRALARRLAARSDVLIENFRPGTLERWGLAPDDLRAENPGLVVARVSGFGQTGPYAARPGFAAVCEGFGGLRHVTGFPGEPPVRANLSLGDSLAGLHAALGILLALFERGRSAGDGGGRGQTVDVAIFEAVYNLMEGAVPEFDRAGVVREPSGTSITGIVPTGTYLCGDGRYLIVGGSGDSIYKRLMQAAGRSDLADDPRLATNEGRVRHREEIDAAIAAWTATLPSGEVEEILGRAAVPFGPIYTVEDMLHDPHYQARGLFEEAAAGGAPLKLPAFSPKLSDTPGRTDWAGPELGAHNREVFGELLGIPGDELAALARDGVI